MILAIKLGNTVNWFNTRTVTVGIHYNGVGHQVVVEDARWSSKSKTYTMRKYAEEHAERVVRIINGDIGI